MEVVQTGPLVCASRSSSSHPPSRLPHRLDSDTPSAMHVQTEEGGGGGLDPSWWKISASGSWDGGERRMRYGKLIDDRPGVIPGAVQRRKLEMLETHAPGASMRVVHSHSTSSWRREPGDVTFSGLSSGTANARRSSVLSSSSSSTRVTSFRQWSSNFSQNSTNSVGIQNETRPAITEFGNLELALNPLDVSFLRTRANVGRSGSIGTRRPPSRGRRASSEAHSGSPEGAHRSEAPGSPVPRADSLGSDIRDIAIEVRGSGKSENGPKEGPESTERSERSPVETEEGLPFSSVLRRKRSVSSEDVRAVEEEVDEGEDPEGKWERGALARRSLPSSEWRSALEGERLRPRDPFKSSSVPALSSGRGSFVTAESLREMKGRLKHRGHSDARSKEAGVRSKDGEEEKKASLGEDSERRDDRRKSWSVGCTSFSKRGVADECEGASNRRRSYAFEYSVEENGSPEDKESPSAARHSQEGRGDAQRGKLRVESQPYLQHRVNEVLKKWSALNKGEAEVERATSSDVSSKVVHRGFDGDSTAPRNSTTWLDHGEAQENEVFEYSAATTGDVARTTTLRVTRSKGYDDACDDDAGAKDDADQVVEESRGLSPASRNEGDTNASKETSRSELTTTSAGISVIFSNADADNMRHRYSVTHLDNKESDAFRTDAGYKIRTSKKVEFSKTEVHFAAESGRFHIVETAGKPPPSNNFRRRRRSPTGTLNVDSGGRVGSGVGSQSTLTNGMRFGDSPYEMRLLAGSDGLELSSRSYDEDYLSKHSHVDKQAANGDGALEYKCMPTIKTKIFNELVIEEEKETKEIQKKIQDGETTSSTFLNLGLEDLSPEKPRGILRSVANLSPWKSLQKDVDEQNEDLKPKFGGVRLRPVIPSEIHSRINVTNPESSNTLCNISADKDLQDAISPGQMELQKLLRSLRPVSITYSDNSLDSKTSDVQVANGGGMEVRISSGSHAGVSNTVIIGEESMDFLTPPSVAQRVREVEERRREFSTRLAGNHSSATRAGGQFSTRVTLGSGSSSVVSLESQIPRKTSAPQIQNVKPGSPKPAAKISTHNNKISRIHSTQGVASGLAGDSLQNNQDASSDITMSARLAENHSETEHPKDVPLVTCIALGFQDKAKDGPRNAESTAEVTKGGHLAVAGCKLDALLKTGERQRERRRGSKAEESKFGAREISPEDMIHSRQGKYKVSSPSKDVGSSWRCIDVKSKKDEYQGKLDSTVKCVKSQRKGTESTSNAVEKSLTKSPFVALSSSSTENKIFQSTHGSAIDFESFKENKVDDVMGKISIKMKVIKNHLDDEKSSASQDNFQGHSKTSQFDYLQRRTNINTFTSASRFSENESVQKIKKENSKIDFKPCNNSVPKSPQLDHKLQAGSQIRNPETPPSNRPVRKRLRRRGSGGNKATPDRRREGAEDDSSILEELTKAADEILHAVNGYSDELTSDEEDAKCEVRNKRRPTKRESASRKLSSYKDQKGSLQKITQKSRDSKTQGKTISATSIENMHGQAAVGLESQKSSRGARVGSPVPANASSSSQGHGSNASIVTERNQKAKQQPVSASRKSMTRIEPTNRVPEVKLIEKRPPLPPGGQRRTTGLKERPEAQMRGTNGKAKASAALASSKDGEASKDAKRPINIARALEAVMPDSRTKTRKMDQKLEPTSNTKISETPKKEGAPSCPASAQSSPGISHSFERKKVASSRDGDKTTRRRVQQNINSPT